MSALSHHRKALVVGALILGAIAAAIIYCINPAYAAWMPKCPVLAFTGLKCPTCGVTRAMHQLMHGHVGQAFALNPGLAVLVPLALAVAVLACLPPSRRTDRWLIGCAVAYVAAYVAWWIIRLSFDL